MKICLTCLASLGLLLTAVCGVARADDACPNVALFDVFEAAGVESKSGFASGLSAGDQAALAGEAVAACQQTLDVFWEAFAQQCLDVCGPCLRSLARISVEQCHVSSSTFVANLEFEVTPMTEDLWGTPSVLPATPDIVANLPYLHPATLGRWLLFYEGADLGICTCGGAGGGELRPVPIQSVLSTQESEPGVSALYDN